ncbi:MAG: hypothetical protein WC565_03290 [Parcubacteria group bacterium]
MDCFQKLLDHVEHCKFVHMGIALTQRQWMESYIAYDIRREEQCEEVRDVVMTRMYCCRTGPLPEWMEGG